MRFETGWPLDENAQISAFVKLKLPQCVHISRQPPAVTAVICRFIVFSMGR